MTMKSWATAYKSKLIEPTDLKQMVAEIKNQNKTITTLNGSFDLMHAGHLHIIYEASQLSDVLIVALNSDLSIQQYKSKLRPIVPLAYRLQLMAALEFVTYVTWFDETDPRRLLTDIQPNVHVNGAEYGSNCIEAELVKAHGGHVHLVHLVPGLSTTQIIQKIKSIDL